MSSEQDQLRIDPDLRRRAEEVDQRSAAQSPEDISSLSTEEIRRRFHELRVHQIELEMQNVQLQQSQVALAASQARYFDLYDMAPVGYCTIGKQGLLMEANLKASNLLGMARSELVGKRFSQFILAEDNDMYYLLRKQLFESSEPQSCELRIVQPDGTTFWAHLSVTLAQDESGAQVSWIILSDITERKEAEEALQANRQRLSDIIKFLPTATFAIDKEGHVIIWNEAIEQMTGIPAREILGKGGYAHSVPFYGYARPQLLNLILENSNEIATRYPSINRERDELGVEVFCDSLYGKGAWIFAKAAPLHDQDGNIIGAIESVRDISERKLSETYGAISREVLQILNEPGDLRHSIQRILAVLKTQTGVDAVGIRLQEGEDYPYFVQEGFPSDFLLKENTLVERTADGGVCRDEDGKVKLECTCGLVISGKTDSTNPLFTLGGSCWTNDSNLLLDIPSNDDPRLNPRNRCIHYDYASVALAPIRDKERIVGLLQLNDRRKECFTLLMVEHLEGIASHIGEALMRKKAEAALQESENRYAETLSVVKTGLWDWNVSSGEAIFSKSYYAILGYEDGEFTASYDTWRDLVHPDDIERVERELSQRIDSGEGFEIELRMKMKSGHWRWVSTCGKVVEKDIGKKALRMLGTLSDISERKQVEAEKTALQAQLLQAQKMEAIGTLAGGIAHDFNNILGAIIGYAEIASDCMPPESEAIDHLNKVQTASQRAATLVKQILAFSRQVNIERIPIKPGHAIKEAVKLLRPSIPSTITIKQELDSSNSLIQADPTQFHQILMNLCTNAFHAMEQTGGVLEIILTDCELSGDDLQHEPELQPGKFVMLSISDTGSGIAPEIRDKIFDPYFTTKEIGKGTGLGLAIAHGIVVSYGGVIKCESEIGKGTVFRVFFPAFDEKGLIEDVLVDKIASTGSERILLVDDEKMLVELGKTMLERLGYEVTGLTSSLKALAIFQNHPDLFDAIITDQTMPGMTGMDLSRQILQIRPGIPIILCTGYSALVNEEQAKAEGIKGFVGKPMTKQVIATLLRKVLDGEKMPSSEWKEGATAQSR